ncbi:MAG: NADH-quinone oxidoreductase subunit N [candidate division KSB1 bacterium]|nr:NADH-quinone oxidoreductase subunit N [candidate division KSB1 bacterium]MDZ7288098.1 NADH-quinone oxidoreductase subunit N [candidate division KSB1 bacterium]MDZ7300199.1 NADH-quinone oxidoreductase subunit N [candidate division KSB1 bacterium]MDZ7305770.1 NADH-quinone oxidoreductase subunit N [candidate division KSB1 bacterium]MDZ7351199.1 NADH-quinone oxidoreductase subunit N [candidate division KSB1 bacterium]
MMTNTLTLSQIVYHFAPTLTLVVVGLLVLLLGMLFPRMYRETLAAVVLFGFGIAVFYAVQNWGESVVLFHGMIVVDKFANGFACLFVIAAGLTLLLSIDALESTSLLVSEFFMLIIFATVGMLLLAASAHLLTLFLGLEILSISLYILAGFRRNDKFSIEASFKYFLLGAFASSFLLYGIALIYGSVGSASLTAVAEAVKARHLLDTPLLTAGLAMMAVGFGFKIALAPFHTWAPDVYQGAPTPIAAFMATGSKAAAFAALLRLVLTTGMMTQAVWQQIFWVLAVLTMTVGNIVALRQDNIKRLLAYSSIAHAGYMLIGVIANNELGSSALLYYLLSYTFMNLGAFGVVAFLSKTENELVNLNDYRGLAFRRPFAAVAMAIFMFSLAGIPITAGFMSKFYVFSAAVQAGHLWLVILGVINSMISLYYYLGVVVVMFMQKSESAGEELALERLPAVGLALIIAVFGTLQLGLAPARWMEAFQDLARSVM